MAAKGILEDNRAGWLRLSADPSGIPNAVEEGLRRGSAIRWMLRKTRDDAEIGRSWVTEGSQVVLDIIGANHDNGEFPNPEYFDPMRANAKQHLSFGFGIHLCLGAPVARMEMEIGIARLLDAFPELHRVGEAPDALVESAVFNGPQSLRVRLSA